MIFQNFRHGWSSLKANKIRTLFTMIGVIIGVTSILVMLSLADGLRSDLKKSIAQFKPNVVVVEPRADTSTIGLEMSYESRTLFNENDVLVAQKTAGSLPVASLTRIGEQVKGNNKVTNSAIVIAVQPSYGEILTSLPKFGQFYTNGEADRPVAVIGIEVARALFGEDSPIGNRIKIKDYEFIIRGVLSRPDHSPFSSGPDLDKVVFIPTAIGKQINPTAGAYQILVGASSEETATEQQDLLTKALKESRKEQDFVVQSAKDSGNKNSELIAIVTNFVGLFALVALFMGGVGIINIMLFNISSRTREIGIRKALGATSGQILAQFLAESVFFSFIGSLTGVLLSLIIVVTLRVTTTLTPSIPLLAGGIVLLMSVVFGTIFGIFPAIAAARKDPIQSLRRE
jgi:putative ABC transport system permease protein